jgi:serine/threonine protein kinase/formylglycine-generating enzyme required for sulfatase activity
MPRDDDQSLGDQQTYEGGAQPADSSDRSLGDQSTFGGGGESSLSDIGGLTGDAELDMEIVDLSRYEVQETLGKGGMGEVLLATDTRLNRKVAIKRMLGDAVKSQTAVKRFLTEAQSIAALNHFNIVQIYDYGRDKDGPFLIMEYLDGGSLLDKCREGALPLEEAVELMCQLCDGLGKAHDAGIIHRDIKPANILLTTDGLPKLTDFGLARQDTGDTGQTMAGAVLGTLDFMPPEQRKDATQTDARSDLWALAATLYQMVSGRSPKIIKFSHVPQALQDVLEKALEDEKDARYQTAAEFREALKGSLTTAEPEPAVVVDLGAGECPKCHTKNEAGRKFCSGCGESLRLSCLSCSGEIPVWENFCAECGGNQKELTSARRAELDVQREQSESLCKEYAFDESLVIAREIAAVEDSRLQHLKEWSETFIAETETEKVRQQQDAQGHFAESQQHHAAFDYPSAIHAIESIPAALRSETVSSYLVRLVSDQQESEELIATISERVQRRDLDGLLEQVDRAVELRGDRADLQKLQTQLHDRRDKRLQQRDERIKQRDEASLEATRLFDIGDAKGALTMIQSVPSEDLRSSDEPLRRQLENIVAAEDKLTTLVQESKADGVLDPDEVAAMWQAANDYLKMNPRHEKIAGLQQQLEARIQKAPAKYADFGELVDFWPTHTITNSLGMKLVPIAKGEYLMGTPGDCPLAVRTRQVSSTDADEEFQHLVRITKSFLIGMHQVTQSQFEQVMGRNPSRFKWADYPVEFLSWQESHEFCQRLSGVAEEQAAGRKYRLPTEAEWEYACRAGTSTPYNTGEKKLTKKDACFAGDSLMRHAATAPVGSYPPNAWGLFDMHGNVWEWTSDWYSEFWYRKSPVEDPQGPVSGTHHTLRGGSASVEGHECRSAMRGEAALDKPEPGNSNNRFSLYGDFGVRVVCEFIG